MTDEKNPYAYGYARMPRIIRKGYKNLTNMQKLLYIYLRDLCGEDGTCYRSFRSLKDETGFSIGYLSGAIPILHNEGLIHAEMRKTPSTHWEVWHISVIDIWEKNAKFIQAEKAKCSPDEQSQAQSVQDMNRIDESVHEMNESVHAMILNKNPTKNQLTENNNREEIVATSAEDRNAPAENVSDFTEWKRKTDPQLPAVKGNTHDLLDTPGNSSASTPGGIREDIHRSGGGDTTLVNETAYHIANSGYEKDGDAPTEKRAVVKIGANNDPHPRDSNGLLDIPGQRVPDLGIAGADRQVRRSPQEEITSQQKPDASVSLSLAVAPRGGQDDTGGRQAIRSPVSLSTLVPAVSSGASLTGNPPASPEARQGRQVIPKRPRGKVTQESAEPMPKSDTREIQRRINEHRGYMLEEKVDIVRERQAIKTWCNLHTIEEYGLVMAGAKNDKYWGKQENYYRIGGLMLLKITPEILARQRAPLQIASNGNGHHSDMVEWQGQWMTVAEADECGFNGGFGLYK